MTTYSVKGHSSEEYVLMATNEDECDGGNVFGIIVNESNEVVVEISDGGFYCPNSF